MAKHQPLATRSGLYGVLALLSLAGYMVIALAAPLAPWAERLALVDISTFAPWPRGTLAYAALLCALFGLYALAYRWAQRRPRPPALLAILLPALFFGLPLVLTYPFNATDVFRYWLNGRITTLYGQNPYQLLPGELVNDPFMRLAGEWAGDSSAYGPLWELVAAALAWISPDNLLLGVTLFKTLGLLTHLALAAMIWQGLARAAPGLRAGRTLLWAWNPTLLLTFVANGHNDVLMLFWLVLGWLLQRRGWVTAGLLVMLLAPLTKLSGLLPIPFFLLAALRQTNGVAPRPRLLATVTAAGLIITWLAFLPFGRLPDVVPGMLQAAETGAGYSPIVMAAFVGRRLFAVDWLLPLSRVGLALFALWGLWLLWRAWRGRPAERGAADINAGYLLLTAKFRIWYASWVFPWLLVDAPGVDSTEDRRMNAYRLRAGVWFLLTTQLSVLIYGQARQALLGGDHLWTHLIAVPFTFGLPLLLAAISDLRQAPGRSRLRGSPPSDQAP